MLNDNPVVLFHSDCSDGFTAAWIARNAMQGRNPLFIPVNYGQKPPDVAFSGHAVYVLDFSYDAPTTELMAERASVLVVLDHHKTAKEALTPLIAKHRGDGRTHIVFDMDKCGARLTWEYFNSKSSNDPPLLVKYVEDRDLWKWQLPHSREISAWLASYPKDFESWDRANAYLDVGPDNAGSEEMVLRPVAKEGEAILRYQARVVENHVKNAVEVDIGGHQVLCCNCTSLISEVGEALGANKVFGATYFIDKEGKKVYSLRSRPPHGIDVSKIAKAKGGGGHAGAAGFRE